MRLYTRRNISRVGTLGVFTPATIFKADMENSLVDSSSFATALTTSRQCTLNSTIRAQGSYSTRMYNGGTGGETTGYAQYAYGSHFDIGTEDFSIECFFAFETMKCRVIQVNNLSVVMNTIGVLTVSYTRPAGSVTITVPNTLYPYEINHICVARVAGVLRVFLNGTMTNTQACTDSMSYTQTGVTLGRNGGYANGTGWATTVQIDSVQIERGRANRWANFTPPSVATPYDYSLNYGNNTQYVPANLTCERDTQTITSTTGTAAWGNLTTIDYGLGDGNWHYWETVAENSINTQYGHMGVAGQTAAQQSTGAVTYIVGYGVNSATCMGKCRGFAVRRHSTGTSYYVTVDHSGVISAAVAISTTFVALFPAVYGNVASGAGSSLRMITRGRQHAFAPNIAASNAGAIYQAPTVPLRP